MISFECDYNNGMLPEILQRLTETNNDLCSGYGSDPYCEAAKQKIREAIEMPEADIFFLVGGTQTNTTVIDSMLQGCEGVICAESGHIFVHESGAVEAFGHKVLTLPSTDSKITAEAIDQYMTNFHADGTYPHMVQPGMVYISFPTELGMLYTRQELCDIYAVCQKHELKLFVDGARLGYGLMSDDCDIDLPFLARHCDVFYIGGTKVGAMFGEAVVFGQSRAPRYMFTNVKRHGALLAKGRMLGLQFDTLFTNDLYLRVSRHAIDMAKQLRSIFVNNGFKMGVDSPTNQQFVILTMKQIGELQKQVSFDL
ncbi:MAG: beta-eliminating lyase-related protein, partial [Bacteroidales bacterium]|nr:beta-eliminating lyase-related protein [Bacteroidales bacterium]